MVDCFCGWIVEIVCLGSVVNERWRMVYWDLLLGGWWMVVWVISEGLLVVIK